MNPSLQTWLETAHKNLVPEAKKLVSEQIREHFSSAVERYQLEGKSLPEAEARAIADLGDTQAAAKKFEQSYLTYAEFEAFARTRDSARSIGCWLICLALFGGSLAFSILIISDARLSHALIDYTLATGLYIMFNVLLARFGSLKQYTLFGWILGGLFVPLIGYSTFQTLQIMFSESTKFSNDWLFFGGNLLFVTIGLFPKYISSWRKLSIIGGKQ